MSSTQEEKNEETNSLIYGYMRLSKKSKNRNSNGQPLSLDEELARQKYLLINAGVIEQNILNEGIASGMDNNRPILNQILGQGNYEGQGSILPKGSKLVVCEYSRLSRDFDSLKQITDRLLQLEIDLIVLDFPLLNQSLKGDNITTKLINTVIRDVLIYVSAQEREYISMRTKQALALKREQGYILGRPKLDISQDLIDKVFQLYQIEHKINSQEAIRMLGCKRSKFFQVMQSERAKRFSNQAKQQ